MESILIIEDEEKIARFVELELTYEGYRVHKATNGRDGLELLKVQPFDLILLDIMLPGINGIEVLRRIRQFSDVPVILLTARDSVMDKVMGLDGGSNDYITKPFAIEELLARIRVHLRSRPKKEETEPSHVLQIGPIKIDTQQRSAWVHSNPVDLTKKEFDLLEYLMKNKNIVMDRDQIVERIWGYDFAGETNAVDVYIRYLRGKIEEPFGIKAIHTVRGVGYVMKDD